MSQDKGNDMAAPEPLANTDTANPPEAIEDKLSQNIAEVLDFHRKKNGRFYEYWDDDISTNERDVTSIVDKLQAIITTETTKARIDELEGMPHTTSIKPYVHERIAALQKEQNQ